MYCIVLITVLSIKDERYSLESFNTHTHERTHAHARTHTHACTFTLITFLITYLHETDTRPRKT